MRIFCIRRTAIFGAAASAALLLTPAGTLAANAGAGAVEGSGTISPALTTTDQAVTGGFNGTAVGGGVIGTTPTEVNDTCTFTFASTPPGDSVATGQGTASGTCSGTASISASLSYTRVGSAVALTGSATVNGSTGGATAECNFVPDSNPVTTFLLVCEVVLGP